MMEDMGGPPVKGEVTKEPTKGKSDTIEDQVNSQPVEVKVMPIMTDSFIPTEDLLDMTPLKLVTVISAEHLLNAVRNIPLEGNSAQDILHMFSGVVKEINKTAAIIKLTAEYVNISSHYMMSALEQFNESNCDQSTFEESVKSLRKMFYKSIVEHIAKSVKELFEKTKQREITGNDMLISSAYHIVTSFQEMTNEVTTLAKEANKKCNSSPVSPKISLPSEDNLNTTQNKTTDEDIPTQGNVHRSIKKDQATNKPEISAIDNNSYNNQDLTIEVFSPEAFVQSKGIDKNSVTEKGPENKPIQFIKVGLAQAPVLKQVPLLTISRSDINEKPGQGQESSVKANQEETKKLEIIDKELASSAVDSLSNVPWESSENGLDQTVVTSNVEKSPQNLWNILQLLTPNYKSTPEKEIQECDDRVVPVCGIDDSIQKFIFFLNDCKLDAYNKLYGTNYKRSSMETCINFFLRNQTQGTLVNKKNDVDLRPR
ncbi:hypothetical protein J6590_057883 [Homalodisca vitripennis]|nr:hypothetical protein J6590_057883 [Homalodisca vitripennis]